MTYLDKMDLFKEITGGDFTAKHKYAFRPGAIIYTHTVMNNHNSKKISATKTMYPGRSADQRFDYELTVVDHGFVCTEYNSPLAKTIFLMLQTKRSSR